MLVAHISVQNALIQAPDVASLASPLVITLLPALPAAWSSGSITSARVRGGLSVNVTWAGGKLTSATILVDGAPDGLAERDVQVIYGGKTAASFTARPGVHLTIS